MMFMGMAPLGALIAGALRGPARELIVAQQPSAGGPPDDAIRAT